MAKKKGGSHPHSHSMEMEDNNSSKVAAAKKTVDEEAPAAMGEEEKVNSKKEIASLKSLNAMLLKETVERRQQVDSLLASNGSLEMEKEALKEELGRLNDGVAVLEMEKQRMEVEMREKVEGLERVVVEKGEVEKVSGEKDLEIEVMRKKVDELAAEIVEKSGVSIRVSRERDGIKVMLDEQIEETNRLVVKLREVEDRERNIGNEVERLKVAIMELGEEKDREIDSIMREKDLAEGKLVESNREIDELRKEIEKLLSEKKLLEKKVDVGEREKQELAHSVSGLNEMIASLKGEKEILHGTVAGLERKCADGLEKERQMGMTIEGLLEEKNEREKIFESVIQEKSLVMNELSETKKHLDLQMQKLEQISQEKAEVEEAKTRGESEIMELNKQLSEFNDTIRSLKVSNLGQVEKHKQLESELSNYRAALDQATSEKSDIKEDLKKEKANGVKLSEKIAEMEKDIEEMEKVRGEMELVSANLNGEKTELENRCSSLKKTMSSLENQLAEAQKEHRIAKAKVKVADANSERVLNLLKNTAGSFVLPSNGVIDRDVDIEAIKKAFEDNVEEVKPYVEELEAIKKAFEGKESKIEEMKRQLEFLENSIAEAHRRKGFWTLVSSATILVAASIAYVARAH